MDGQLLLEARGLTKRYGRRTVLDGMDLQVRAGQVTAIVGQNGAGKTTALRICAGLTRPDAGDVRRNARVGYCPQEPGLVDLLSADEHLILFGAALGLPHRQALETGRANLAEFGFPDADRTVAKDLSGGTRQKLNLALALLGEPRLLLLDEPYQGFDHGSYVDFWAHVTDWRDQGRAVVVVTHLLTEEDRVDRIVELREQRAQPAMTTAAVAGEVGP